MENKMLISKLALMYGVSRSTLLYYDKIGLLVPSHDKDTGYRYYSEKDKETLELIIILRETGLSLKGIKEFLNCPTHLYNINLLQLKKIELQQKISELQQIECTLEKKILQLKSIKNKAH